MSSRNSRVTALIAAGGTGGHVYPALAVAQVMVHRGADPSGIHFVTERRELSTRAIRDAGFGYDVLPLRRGLQRRLSLANVRVVVDSLRSIVVARRLIRARRPDVVIGFGAYVTLPVVIAARLGRVPVVVHEQNRAPGLANRLAVRLGGRAAVSLPGTKLAGAVLTGNPVRPAIAAAKPAPQCPPLVAIFGGSLGAAVLNEAAIGLASRWRDRADVVVRHVTGTRFYGECADALAASRGDEDGLDYQLVDYEPDMAAMYAGASVVVARSGGSVAEIAAVGVPAVLVPWSGATGDHQTANAETFAAAGAALLIPERECDAARLDAVLTELLANPDRLAGMRVAMSSLARPDAADRVADLVEAVARP